MSRVSVVARLVEEVVDLLDRGVPASEVPEWFGCSQGVLAGRLFDVAPDVAWRLHNSLRDETRTALIAL